MKKVGHMLDPALGRKEVFRVAKAQKVLRDWAGIVGENLAARSFPDRYDHGTVWIAVEGSAWAQELRMQQDQILSRLRERAGDENLFRNLRFGVRPLPEAPQQEQPKEPQIDQREGKRGLSIREIAERRLKNWPHGDDSAK
jgi:predicted nucleic acid-binding Zn ribbon protein